MADTPTPYVPSAPPSSPNRNPPEAEALRSPTGSPEKFGWVAPSDVHNVRLAASELARGATHPIAVELRDLALRLDREIQERAARQDLGFAPTSPDELPAQAIVDAGLNVFALTLWCESYRKFDHPPRLEFVYRGCRVSIERWPAPADVSSHVESPGACVYDYPALGAELRASLDRYARDRIETGGMLRAALENDLEGTVRRMHLTLDTSALRDLTWYITNELPSPCHGSPEAVRRWLAQPTAASPDA